jgi:hypothetical protein
VNLEGLTYAEKKKIYKQEETNLKRSCTFLLKRYGGFSLPIPGGIGSINGSPDRICFYAGRAVCIEFKRPGQDLSNSQKEMRANIQATGCEYHLVRNENDFIAAMQLPVRKLF